MVIVEPDFTRRIDIPGTGPCRRPVDIDGAKADFSSLVALRVYAFDEGMVIDGEAEADEVFVVLMRGRAAIRVEADGAVAGDHSLDTDGGSRAVYLPPHAAYCLTATTSCDVAYGRVTPPVAALKASRAFAPSEGALAIPCHAAGMALALRTLAPDATLTLDGPLSERFIHVRSDRGGAALVSGTPLSDWHSAALGAGEPMRIEIKEESVDLLMVSASMR